MIRHGYNPISLRSGWQLLFWPALFWILAFLIPLGTVIFRALDTPGSLAALAASPYYRGVFGFTLKQAGLSTFFSVLLGLPGAWLVGRCRFPGRGLLKSLTTIPFVLPPILAVLGFILVFGNAGFINEVRLRLAGGGEPWRILYSIKAIIMAHVFYNFPLTLRIVGDAWADLNYNPHRASRVLGAGANRTLWLVDIPRLFPAILTAAILTFIYCFMSFTIILVLGGGPELSTLEVEVYRLVKYGLDFAAGSSLALVGSTFLILLMGAYAWISRRSSFGLEGDEGGKAPEVRLNGRLRIAAAAYLFPALVLVAAPLLAVVINSFLARTTRTGPLVPSLSNWIRVFGGGRISAGVPLAAVARSLLLGTVVAAVTTATAGTTAWFCVTRDGRPGRIVNAMVSLPMAVSSVILGLGYLIIANRIPNHPWIRIAALILVHTVLALPFAHRIIVDRLRTISPRVRQAARSSGAGPIRAFLTIELPLARRGLVTAAVFAMAISAGEMNATLILAPGGFTTMPLAIYRMIGAYDMSGASALGTLLILICGGAFMVLDRFAEEPV